VEKLRASINFEHDRVYALDLDPKTIAGEIIGRLVIANPARECDKITEHGLSALLQAGKTLFGDKWYGYVVEELNGRYRSYVRIREDDSLFR
jgi:hypothetical protein